MLPPARRFPLRAVSLFAATVLLSGCGARRGELFGAPEGTYTYCPSVIQEDDGSRLVFYCTNPKPYLIRDHVGMRRGTRDRGPWRWSDERIVFSPAESGWDSVHVCDPDVVKGVFHAGATTYAYALFYLGCDTLDNTHNQVGVAFAASPEGPWVRWALNPVAPYEARDRWWGTGQPSVVSLDKAGELLLFYTRGDAAGTRMVVRELDLLSLEAPVIGTERELSRAGLTESDGSAVILHNGALARDAISGGFFLVRERHPFDSATPSFISAVLQVAATDSTDPAVSGATWRLVGQIDAARSGRPRNHNASIVKDAYGSPPDPSAVEVAYTVSDLGGGYLWTYRIRAASIPVAGYSSPVTLLP